MRSEYLFSKGRYTDIHFKSFQGKVMHYTGGNNHKALHGYLRKVYSVSNTSTLRHELKKKKWEDLAPGDVLVYEADDRRSVGHAILIVDVAINPRTGKKAFLFAQSSLHFLHNPPPQILPPFYHKCYHQNTTNLTVEFFNNIW